MTLPSRPGRTSQSARWCWEAGAACVDVGTAARRLRFHTHTHTHTQPCQLTVSSLGLETCETVKHYIQNCGQTGQVPF